MVIVFHFEETKFRGGWLLIANKTVAHARRLFIESNEVIKKGVAFSYEILSIAQSMALQFTEVTPPSDRSMS
jgi:hypothetical protein